MRVMADVGSSACRSCGQAVSATAKFCRHCGAKLELAPSAVAKPSVAPSASEQLSSPAREVSATARPADSAAVAPQQTTSAIAAAPKEPSALKMEVVPPAEPSAIPSPRPNAPAEAASVRPGVTSRPSAPADVSGRPSPKSPPNPTKAGGDNVSAPAGVAAPIDRSGSATRSPNPAGSGKPGAAPVSMVGGKKVRRKSGKGPAIAVVGAIVLVAFAGGGWWLLRDGGGTLPSSLLGKGEAIVGKPGASKVGAATDQAAVTGSSTPVWPAKGKAEVVDTATLKVGGTTVRLEGVTGVGGPLAAQMQSFLQEQGGELTCNASGNGTYKCLTQSGHDVASAALLNGAARTADGASEAYRQLEAQAQAAKRGVWQ